MYAFSIFFLYPVDTQTIASLFLINDLEGICCDLASFFVTHIAYRNKLFKRAFCLSSQ